MTIAQWRHVQIDDIDAIKQVGAEGAIGDFFFQLPVGGANHAHFHFLVFLRADAAELAVLQQLQQLRLQTHVEFGDFIEEQRAAMRHLHSAWLGAEGARERSFFVTEELALQQRSREWQDNSPLPKDQSSTAKSRESYAR